jgi:hypothetical protein
MFFKDWPADAKRPGDFNSWAEIVGREWKGVYDWKEFGVNA